MASSRDNDDGIRVELPFISLRLGNAGWRWHTMTEFDDDAYERARRRVRARLSLYRHLATFAAVMGAILFIDLVTGGGVSDPVLWLAGIWGGIIVLQAANTFLFPAVWSRETEERMIQEELRRQQRPAEPPPQTDPGQVSPPASS
jgi:hypothetical protein